MPVSPTRQPRLLSQLNERSVLRVLQSQGPCSRAEVTRRMGVTAPTVSKAVASLLRSGLLEEFDVAETGRGRPAKRLRLASVTAQVLGLVLDARQCQLVTAGLDGAIREQSACRFATPATYEQLLDEVVQRAEPMCRSPKIQTLGLGISMPGLIDYRQSRGILSPNVPITNGRTPAADLGERLGLDAVLVQETHALSMAERMYGLARGLDDFAMLDATTGVGLAVFSGGRLLTGHSGLAGEIGHVPLEPRGRACGCGRRGCLETVASDTALTWSVSQRLRRTVDIDELVTLVRQGRLKPAREVRRACEQLAKAIAMVVNLYNPSNVFVYSRMFELDETLLVRLNEESRRHALGPSFDGCRIQRARARKSAGAIAGIIHYLTDSRLPSVSAAGMVNRHGHSATNRRNAAAEMTENA
jgi:predicted NBD/HSP70 family sugar kinase